MKRLLPKGVFCHLSLLKSAWLKLPDLRTISVLAFVVFTHASMAQGDLYVRGTVTDEAGQPMPGVTVLVKQSTIGTSTDSDGKYTISIPRGNENSVLIFSFVGYTALEMVVGTQSTLNVQMTPDIATLMEVVVVGYGTQNKKDVTGSISTISTEQMNQGAFTNPLQQIAGRAAGVSVSQTGSEPGAAPSVRIRGITSLVGGNDPLVVVDGVQGNMDLLNQIPPSEIESMDILKDASATAIYGSRGAPGVIIVTTKKGKEGRASVEYNMTSSLDFIPKKLKVLDANQWWQQAQVYGVPGSANHGANTDWFDILTQTGSTQNHTLSYGSGTDKFTYRASLSAILQNGVVVNSSNKRYIGSLQATQRALDDKLTLSMNLNSSVNNTVGSPTSVGRASFTSNLITNSYLMRPTDPVYDVDGSYYSDPRVFQYINPYAVAETIINEGRNNNLFGSFRADLEIIEGLTAGWFGSWRKTDTNWGYYLPAKSTITFAIDNQGVASISNNRQDERLMNISLNYRKEINDHSIAVLGLYEWQNQAYQGNFTQAKGFINDIATYNALQVGDLSRVNAGDISSYKNDRTLVSFLSRINYSFANRYLLTVSMRRDGSTVFGENHKWGNFPSASLGWRIDQESFMADQNVFKTLKLRGGYGVTGNQQGLYPQNSVLLVGSAGATFFGGSEVTNFRITQNANADLRWETRKQFNVGLDFGILDGKLNGTLDAFTATTDNLLFNYTVPRPPYPYGSIYANVGSMLNQGIELSLNYELINSGNTTVSIGGNFTQLRNEVKKLSGSINGVPLNTNYVPWGPNAYLIEGESIGTFNILQHTGKNEVNAETVLDRNGDGEIDQGARSEDRRVVGSALPTQTYAFTTNAKHKRWDASMVWRGSRGNKIYNGLRQSLSMMENLGRANVLQSAVDLGIYTSQYGSDLWLENGSFFRLDNISIGYSLPSTRIKFVERMRLSLTGNNLLLFTKYSGVDPEINVNGGNGAGGDYGIYPRTRSIAIGLNVVLK